MKIKLSFLLTFVLVFIFSVNFATANPKGGFVPNKASAAANTITTVEEAKQLPDDAKIIVEGYITKQISHEYYEFKDNTGTITLEVDDDDWDGLNVKPSDKVQIYAEVEKGFNKIKLEAKSLRLAN